MERPTTHCFKPFDRVGTQQVDEAIHLFTGFEYPILGAGAEEGAETMITDNAFDFEDLSSELQRDSRAMKSVKVAESQGRLLRKGDNWIRS